MRSAIEVLAFVVVMTAGIVTGIATFEFPKEIQKAQKASESKVNGSMVR